MKLADSLASLCPLSPETFTHPITDTRPAVDAMSLKSHSHTDTTHFHPLLLEGAQQLTTNKHRNANRLEPQDLSYPAPKLSFCVKRTEVKGDGNKMELFEVSV